MGSPHLPAEMVEEILLYLPVKSLRRFSSVSKAWKSMISEAGFEKRYRGRGRERVVLDVVEFEGRSRLPGCERIFLNIESRLKRGQLNFLLVDDVPICPFSCSSTSSPEVVVCPFESRTVVVMASCDELWLATDASDYLFLWNPSMRTYKKIFNFNTEEKKCGWSSYEYGVGYDSVGDEYKILKISSPLHTAELYSLRSGKWWRDIPVPVFPYLTDACSIRGPVVCVSGNLHMISYNYDRFSAGASSGIYDLVSFNLSTEKFGKVALPNSLQKPYQLELLSVLRGVLCLGLNYYPNPADEEFVIWVMEEYGVATSWTKKFCIKYHHERIYHGYPGPVVFNFTADRHRPLYFGENGELLSMVHPGVIEYNAVYKDDESKPQPQLIIFSSYRNDACIRNVYTYVESLVSLED